MKTPEEIKKSLKTAINGCMLSCGSCNEECSYAYYCGPVNVFQHATAIPKIMVDDALALIEQLERERDDALVLIGKLIVILKKYPNAATNHCAYDAYSEIKKWLVHIKKPLPEPPKEE